MPAFDTFLFDLDGTLIDHFKAIHRSYAHTLPLMGLPAPTPQQVREAVGGGLENAMSKFVEPGRIGRALEIYREYWNRTMLDDVEAMPGALALLKGLKREGAAAGVLTNKVGSSSRLICDKLGFSSFLEATIGAGDTAWLKPQRELSEHALRLLHGRPESALMVGDSPFDVETGRNGGFRCWVVTTGTHTAQDLVKAGADAVFDDLYGVGSRLGLVLS